MSREKAIQSIARAAAEDHLQELRVESVKSSRRHSDIPVADKKRMPKTSSRSTDFVYVNRAYTGSTNDVESVREAEPIQAPVTSVIREQYWTCSKWPFAQRILAITVGVLLGAVVGLAVTMAIQGKDVDEVIGSIFPAVPG